MEGETEGRKRIESEEEKEEEEGEDKEEGEREEEEEEEEERGGVEKEEEDETSFVSTSISSPSFFSLLCIPTTFATSSHISSNSPNVNRK